MSTVGNYHGYQGSSYRLLGSSSPAAHLVDPRLTLIERLIPVFCDRWVLDIGCNNGAVTVQLGASFGAASVTGIDVDRELIRRAQSHLSFQRSRMKPGRPTELTHDSMHYFPVSSVLDHGHRPLRQEDDEGERVSFPNNVKFVCEDWALHLSSPSNGQRRHDTVLALSVVKWIHLQHLDTGLRRFFTKVNFSLRLGGHFVLEIQPWQSYEKAIKPNKSPHLAENLVRLEIRPEQHFDGLLEELGLAKVATSDALPRRISIYRKVKDISDESDI